MFSAHLQENVNFVTPFQFSFLLTDPKQAIDFLEKIKEKVLSFFFQYFYTPSHDSGRVLWFHLGHLCVRPSVHILFQDDNMSKHQWIFTKLGICIDILEICFGIANGQIS